MEKRRDYYDLLGVEQDATPRAIERAFRRLARECRPQRDPGTAARLRELQTAYETLADAERRRRYDERQSQLRAFDADGWTVLGGPRPALRRPIQPVTVSCEVMLAEDQASRGGMIEVQVPYPLACSNCDATGGYSLDCPVCGGHGRIDSRAPTSLCVPAGVRDGTVFQVVVDVPAVRSVLVTVHVRT